MEDQPGTQHATFRVYATYTGHERVDTAPECTRSGDLQLDELLQRMWGIGRHTLVTREHAVFPATGHLAVVRNTRVLTGIRVRLAHGVVLHAH